MTRDPALAVEPTIFGVRRTLALLFVVSALWIASAFVLVTLWMTAQSVADRTARSFRTITAPNVTMSRFTSASSTSGQGWYYERPGETTIVVVLADLPAPPPDQWYLAWFSRQGQVYVSQRLRPDRDGVARIILDAVPEGYYDRIFVTLENRTAVVPSTQPLLTWTR